MQAGRCLMTHSLLNSWLYMYSDFSKYGDNEDEFSQKAHQDFLNTLNKIRSPTTEAQQKGIDFEDLVVAITQGRGDEGHKWYEAAAEVAEEVKGGQFQLTASKEIVVDGITLLLYGRLDCLKAGRISDIKFSSGYEVGKYFGSPQHPTYFELIPEAKDFRYLVSNGSKVWREDYRRGEHRPVMDIIHDFFGYLRAADLLQTYLDKWPTKN